MIGVEIDRIIAIVNKNRMEIRNNKKNKKRIKIKIMIL